MADQNEEQDDIDALMEDAFGTVVDDEHLQDEDEENGDEGDPGTEDDDEGDEDEGSEEEDLENAYNDDLEEDEGDEEIDDTGEEDDSELGDDDGESEGDGDPAEGDGADDTLSDGQIALNMMVEQRLAGFKPTEDAFDDKLVGEEAAFIEDAKATLGDEFDEAYHSKMGKLAYRSALRQAKTRFEASAEARLTTRRDAGKQRMTAQVQELAGKAPDELARVDKHMSAIYSDAIARYGEDAAMQVPVEVWFRLAGGHLAAPKPKPKSTEGVASRTARKQKQKAVKAQRKPDQIGRVRTPSGGKKKNGLLSGLNEHLSHQKHITDFFFEDPVS